MTSSFRLLALFVLVYLSLATAMGPLYKVRRLLAQGNGTGEGDFTVVTYNTDLLNRTRHNTDEDRVRIPQALSSLQSDVLCINEAWDDRDQQSIVDAVRSHFPYYLNANNVTFSNNNSAPINFSAPCSLDEFANLTQCASSNCRNDQNNRDDLLSCLQSSCNQTLQAAFDSEECTNCLYFTMRQNGYADDDNNGNDLVQAVQAATNSCSQASPRRWDSNWGLLLLSALPFTQTAAVKLPGFDRGYLTAQMNTSFGLVEVTCTQVTRARSGSFWLTSQSYAQENADQVQALLSGLSNSTVPNQILAGDFTEGPDTLGLNVPSNGSYQHILNAGWLDAWFWDKTNVSNACTWCRANPLTHDNDDQNDSVADDNMAMDHIFFKGFANFSNSTRRLFDTETPPLSDHYGVQLTLTPPTM